MASTKEYSRHRETGPMPYSGGYAEPGDEIPDKPEEPVMTARARELLGYLNQLEDLQHEISARLIVGKRDVRANDAKNPNEPCLEELIAKACTIAACLVGQHKTILRKL